MPYTISDPMAQQDVTIGGNCVTNDLVYTVTITPTPPGTAMFTKHESDPYGAEWATSDASNVGVYTVSVSVYSTSECASSIASYTVTVTAVLNCDNLTVTPPALVLSNPTLYTIDSASISQTWGAFTIGEVGCDYTLGSTITLNSLANPYITDIAVVSSAISLDLTTDKTAPSVVISSSNFDLGLDLNAGAYSSPTSYTVEVYVINLSGVTQTDPLTFDVEFTDPCWNAVIDLSAVLDTTAFSYTLGDSSGGVTFNFG